MMRALLPLLLLVPGAVFAAGGSSEPSPTETTKICSGGKIYDSTSKSCVNPKRSGLSDDMLYEAARELAYDGQLENAQQVLLAMSDQQDDRVLTYWGYTHRKMGQWDLGMDYYQQALAVNPDNVLTRSYMGQALIQAGDMVGALAQLREIEARGEGDSWPGQSLRLALLEGQPVRDY